MNLSLHDSLGQPAWTLDNGEISLTLTRQGAHMAPVVFRQDNRELRPYSISPWQGEGFTSDCRVLEPLRGDFFCMPFGGNGTEFNGEHHPPHGETCGELWTLAHATHNGDTVSISLSLEPKVRRGKILRTLSLIKGHHAIYSTVTVTGFVGPSSFAHHAILNVPDQPRSLLLSTSPFALGLTVPYAFDDARTVVTGKHFVDLTHVPTELAGLSTDDYSSFPAPRRHTDLLGMFETAAPDGRQQPAWVTAVNTVDRWLWFAFKNPAVMPARMLWIENRGRVGTPWNGRTRCLGLEDGCAFFDAGLAESVAPNCVNRQGIPTVRDFPGTPVELRYIQGAVAIPEEFTRVNSVTFSPGEATFTDVSGRKVAARVDTGFLF